MKFQNRTNTLVMLYELLPGWQMTKAYQIQCVNLIKPLPISPDKLPSHHYLRIDIIASIVRFCDLGLPS